MKENDNSLLKIYESEARVFDSHRDKSLFEKNWLDFFVSHLASNDCVLDIGCGTGMPISNYFIKNNIDLIGLDFSSQMIKIARDRFPQNEWVHADMRSFLLNKKFNGIIAWNSLFHLNHNDQVITLGLISQHLKNNGVFMFTAGPSNGEVTGRVNGKIVKHYSFSASEYEKILKKENIKLTKYKLSDKECNNHSVFLGIKVI